MRRLYEQRGDFAMRGAATMPSLPTSSISLIHTSATRPS